VETWGFLKGLTVLERRSHKNDMTKRINAQVLGGYEGGARRKHEKRYGGMVRSKVREQMKSV